MKCSNCGFESNQRYCPNCMQKLEISSLDKLKSIETISGDGFESKQTTEPVIKTSEIKKSSIIVIVVMAFFIIALVFGIALSNNKKSSPDNNDSKSSKYNFEYDDDYLDDEWDDDYDYLDDDNDYLDDEYDSTPIKITYEKLTTKELYENYEEYEDYDEYVKTTIKVTKANNEYGIYEYKVYDLDGYDEVVIAASFDKKTKIKKGDYITVSGLVEIDDYYPDSLTITINVDKKNKTNKKLFKSLGSERKIKFVEDQYKVGVDIPAGTYIAYPTDSYGGYYEIDSDSNGENIIANDNFKGQCYFSINDGEYLELSRCEAYSVAYKKTLNYKSGHTISDGQYLVGDDIPAGEYKVVSTDKYGGYYEIDSDPNGEDIIANDNFNKSSYVTVYNGQYLTLSRCSLTL